MCGRNQRPSGSTDVLCRFLFFFALDGSSHLFFFLHETSTRDRSSRSARPMLDALQVFGKPPFVCFSHPSERFMGTITMFGFLYLTPANAFLFYSIWNGFKDSIKNRATALIKSNFSKIISIHCHGCALHSYYLDYRNSRILRLYFISSLSSQGRRGRPLISKQKTPPFRLFPQSFFFKFIPKENFAHSF